MEEQEAAEHVASLLDDGGLEQEIEDKLASQADFGPDEEGFLESEPGTGEPVADKATGEAGPVIVETEDAGVASFETLQAQIEEVKKESDGRLAALVDNREKMRQANEGIESMRQLMYEWERKAKEPEIAKQELAQAAEKYGVDVVADPSNQYITDQLRGFEERREYERQTQEGRKRQVAATVQAQRAERVARQQAFSEVQKQEQVFVESTPDYGDAYGHLRKSRETFYKNIYPGKDIQPLLDREEEVIIAETLKAGQNVPQRVYEMATQLGYQPGDPATEVGETHEDPALSEEARVRRERVKQFRSDNEFPDVDRLKAAQKNQPLQGGSYNRGGNAKVLKGQQVFDQLPKAKRMEIFADPERFKRFVLTGNVEM